MKRIKSITEVAMAAILITLCSWMTVPYVVPFTMQTFAVFFVLHFLGGKKGIGAIILYILLGIVGIPVFSGFGAGIGHILGPTGGYVVGFLFMGIVYLIMEPFARKKKWMAIVSLVLGLLLCYFVGTMWFYRFYTGQSNKYTIVSVTTLCVVPYILPDLVKMFLAVFISSRVKKSKKTEE